ncbi:hypothetical protein D3C71_1324570 [compost metagenome]
MIAQFVRVVLVATDTATESSDKRRHFLRREHLVEARFLNVKDFTFQWQNRLVLTVTALLGRSARRVPFHKVQFRASRIAFLTVRQFAWQTSKIQRTFTTGHFTGFTRRFASTCRIDNFADDDFRV